MANELEFRTVWGRLTNPVQRQLITLAQYPTGSNHSYMVGMLWALQYTGYLNQSEYTYLLALTSQIVQDATLRDTFKGWTLQ